MASQAETLTQNETPSPASTRAAWLKARRLGIGASDTPAILGVSSWAGPVSVYADKAGLSPVEDAESEPDYLILGRLSEATNAAMLQRKTALTVAGALGVTVDEAIEAGLETHRERGDFEAFKAACETVYEDESQAIHRSKRWPFLQATFDDLAVDEAGPLIVEYKNAHNLAGWEDGPQGVREAYFWQVQHQLAVSGLRRAVLSVLVGGSRHEVFWVERDEAAIDRLVAAAEDMARRVLEGDPPDPVGNSADDAAIELVAGARNETGPVALPAEIEALDLEYQAAKDAEREAKKRAKEAQQAIVMALGSHEAGELPSGVGYTYKAQVRNPALSLSPDQWGAIRRAVAHAADHGLDVGPKLRDAIEDTAEKEPSAFRVLRRKAARKGGK